MKKTMSKATVKTIGKISPKEGFAFAEGSTTLLEKIGFIAKLGKFVMPIANFITISKPLGEVETDIISLSSDDLIITGKTIDKQAWDEATKEYWEEQYEKDYGKPYDPTAKDPYATEDEKAKEDEEKQKEGR